ncbi:PREDICTED: uncharacterized protein LOC109589357, partial [Amphimedon queenslandica]|uniref:Uncharacterized protein n=1 Tax=Amphimedon queenslandica TaxID=400682 RepID=A0AAN0JVS4_AMPQE
MIIGYYTVYEVNDTSTPTTKQQYASLSARPSSDLSKQLMLSLKIQLINSEEEVATLNEESKAMKENVASLKETLEAKSKMLSANIAESNKFKELAAETQMLQKKVSHLTEENEGLKEKKKILEEQLASFQSKKGDIEDKEERKIEKLQSTDTTFEIETLRKILKQKDEEIKQERAAWSKEKKLLLEKITTMNLQLIEKNKLVQEKEQVLRLTSENLEKGERRHLDDVSAKGSTSDSAHFPITKNENDSHDSSESQNSEQEKKE